MASIVFDTQKPQSKEVSEDKSTREAASATQNPDALDFASLTLELRRALGADAPVGLMEGKTRMRTEVMSLMNCSSLKAEEVVDSLLARGHARFQADQRFGSDPRYGRWTFEPSP